MTCRDTGTSVEALAALLWREALVGGSAVPCPSTAPWSRSSPLGDHCSESRPAGNFRAGTVRAGFGTPIPCVYFWKLQGRGAGSSLCGEPPRSLLVLMEAPGKNHFPHPFHSGGSGSPELAAFPPSSQLITLTSASVSTSPSL